MMPVVRAHRLHAAVQQVDSRLVGVDVAWTDNARGQSNGQLSCWGKNITDQVLVAQDGQHLPMIRTPNYNELVGPVTADKIHCGSGATFKDVWDNLETYIGYTGVICKRPEVLKKIVMRFQSAFVGVHQGQTRNICPSNFSYQTATASDPRNLLLVATSTGIYAHTDGVGYKKLLAHTVQDDGMVQSHWFEAEESDYAPGSSQLPDEKKGIARVSKLGLEGAGDRCNRMLIISIPLKQTAPREEYGGCTYRSMSVQEVGTCRAARLSVGDVVGTATGPAHMEVEVDETEYVMCTQIEWHVLVSKRKSDEVTISEDDAELVAKDMMKQYGLCDAMCNLSELGPWVHALEEKHMAQIADTMQTVAKVDPAMEPQSVIT